MPLLRVEGLSIRFGGLAALADVSFDVAEGEIVGLIGPNGAGKSTVFNVLTGLYRADAGRVTFAGDNLVGLTPHAIARRGIARTFQNTEIFRPLSVLDNVRVGLHSRLRAGVFGAALWLPRVAREERRARERARDLLAFVGLSAKADELARNLPYGDQRRLEIARALATEPRLLLLDEPTAGMNPQESAALTDFMRECSPIITFSIAVIVENRRMFWNVRAMPAFMTMSGRAPVMSRSPNRIRPIVGR